MLKVLYFIETHLDDGLDVQILAREAGYSPYHFCRIFKASVGESAISYVTKLRLQRATLHVLDCDKSIIEIALDAGFETPNGFNKAFKKIFGLSPREYRNRHVDLQRSYKDKMMQIPKIVQRDESYIVCKRATGAYEKSSQIAWQKLLEEMEKGGKKFQDGSLSFALHEFIGICHDDPSTTVEKDIRYDASIVMDKIEIEKLAQKGIETKTISDGKYAMLSYQGGYDKAMDAWMALYAWATDNGYTFRDLPPFEKYLNSPMMVSEEELLTEIYVPIV